MFGLASNVRALIIGGIVSASIAFSAGYIVRDAFADAEERKQLASIVGVLTEREAEFRDIIDEQNASNLESAILLQEARQSITDQRNRLDTYVNDLDEVTSGLRVSAGYLRLLDDAIRDPNRTTGVPDSTGSPSYSDPQDSGVAYDELVRWQLDTIEQYQSVYQQCTQLIEWNTDQLDIETRSQ